MLLIERYIFRNLFFTTLAIMVVLVCAVWLTQSLRFVEFMVTKGLSLWGLTKLISFLIPDLVVLILPLALFASTLFHFNKLAGEHELTAMRNASMSNSVLARPALFNALLGVFAVGVVAIYILPEAFSRFRAQEISIRDHQDMSALEMGTFNQVGKLMIYVHARDASGLLKGIFFKDERDPLKSVTLTAAQGHFYKKGGGFYAALENGTRQEMSATAKQPNVIYFNHYTMDVESQEPPKTAHYRKPYEMSLQELFFPVAKMDEKAAKRLKAEGHQRLLAILYPLSFVAIALLFLLSGYFDRKGRVKRIMASLGVVLCIQTLSMALLNSLSHATYLVPLAYTIVCAPLVVGLVALGRQR